MEPKSKRAGYIVLNRIEKTDLYPDGKYYHITLLTFNRKGEIYPDRVVVVKDTIDEALDVLEFFLEEGIVRDEYKKT